MPTPADAGEPSFGAIYGAGSLLARGINSLVGATGRGLTDAEIDRFRAAGGTAEYDPSQRIRQWTFTYQGRTVNPTQVRNISRNYQPQPLAPPTAAPGTPVGSSSSSSAADQPIPTLGQSSWAPWLFQYGRGPTTRGRKKRKKKAAQVNPYLPTPYVCGTDSECEEMFPGLEAFVMPMPTVPDVLPDFLPAVVPRVVTTVVGGILSGVGMILFPSTTADDDMVSAPHGPRTRVPGKRPQPYGWPLPDWQGRWKDPFKIPGWIYEDFPNPVTVPTYEPIPQPVFTPDPTTYPVEVPTAQPFPMPKPTPVPTGSPYSLPSWADDLWPFLVPLITGPGPAKPGRVKVPNRDPLTDPNNAPLPSEWPQYLQPPTQADTCQCEAQRKRKKKGCTNPVTSRRTTTRGGKKYRTITRYLKCPA